MILSSQEIDQLSKAAPRLIEEFDPENLRPSSYDLTVGEEYYLGQDGASSTLVTKKLKKKQSFTIPPHAVCFILATEKINLPEAITAKVSLRMTHIYAGLVLTAQPPFDPRYSGRVIVMLHNLSSEAFHIKSGDRLATIEFMRVGQIPALIKTHRSVLNLEEQLTKPLVSSLSEIANLSASAHEKVNWISSQMLVFAALIVAVLAVPGFFSLSALSDHVKDQNLQLEKMSRQLEIYKKDLEGSQESIQRIESQFRTASSAGTTSDITKSTRDVLRSKRPQ